MGGGTGSIAPVRRHGPESSRVRNGFEGLIPAAFTPLNERGDLDLARVQGLADHLVRRGVRAVFIAGSTGEGESLTVGERRALTEAWSVAAADRLPVIVQVGRNCIRESEELAAHAEQHGAAAIAAAAPSYFPIADTGQLVDALLPLAEAAPETPLFYYHIPRLTRAELDMVSFLHEAGDRLPTLAGLKYSDIDVCELIRCIELDDGRFEILFGADEMLLLGLQSGCRAAVGSTYNFMAPLFCRIIAAFERGDLPEAARCQTIAVRLVEVMLRHGGQPALKACMQLIDQDCGPVRPPQRDLTSEQRDTMRAELDALGLFEWT